MKGAEYVGASAVDTCEVARDLRLSRAYCGICDLRALMLGLEW